MKIFSGRRSCLFLLVVICCLLFVAGCKKRGEDAKPVPPPVAEEQVVVASPAEVKGQGEIPRETEPVYYSLTYRAGEHGSLAGEVAQRVKEGAAGTAVTAVAAEGYHFAGWSDGITGPERVDSALTGNVDVVARFKVNQYAVIYSAAANGTISGVVSQSVAHGGTASPVTALPAAGYHFVSWSDGLSEARRSDLNVTGPLALTATFAINRYNMTYSAGENGKLEGQTSQTIDHNGDASPVEAMADRGYHFVDWSDGVATPRRVDVKVTADLNVSARFAVNTYRIGGTVTGLVTGSRLLLRNNDGDDLEIKANGEFGFATELLDAKRYAVTVLAQPQAPDQICSIKGESGILEGKDVSSVSITCVLKTYNIGGTVFGLPDGGKIVLRNNQDDTLTITGNGPFVFNNALDDGSRYAVEVYQPLQKPNWTCDVKNASKTLAGADVGDIEIDCYQQVVLQAVAGIKKVRLDWNAGDFKGVTFDLCQAREELTGQNFERCRQLDGGTQRTGVTAPLLIEGLKNDTTYRFLLKARAANGRLRYSESVKATPFGGLNDSGIDWCADDGRNSDSAGTRMEKSANCAALATSHPGQDAIQGRDFGALSQKLKKTGSGKVGFDFTKLCRSGEAAGAGKCPSNPLPGDGFDNWACTRDNVTGLTWEIKEDRGLRSKTNTYSWYQPDKAVNGGDPGLANRGKCEGSACDTHSYVQAVKAEKLCGADDWRLPTRKELLSIVDNSRVKPAGDPNLFPDLLAEHYWTSSPYAEQKNSAWQIYFLYGEASPAEKSQANAVRLVRGRTGTFGLSNP